MGSLCSKSSQAIDYSIYENQNKKSEEISEIATTPERTPARIPPEYEKLMKICHLPCSIKLNGEYCNTCFKNIPFEKITVDDKK